MSIESLHGTVPSLNIFIIYVQFDVDIIINTSTLHVHSISR